MGEERRAVHDDRHENATTPVQPPSTINVR